MKQDVAAGGSARDAERNAAQSLTLLGNDRMNALSGD
jgi:hypothetical protein